MTRTERLLQGKHEEAELSRQAEREASGPYVRTQPNPNMEFSEGSRSGNTGEFETPDASSDVYSDNSGEERQLARVRPSPRFIVETSLNTDVLCLLCATLGTGILAPWNIEDGWSVVQPLGRDRHGVSPRLIAEYYRKQTLENLRQSRRLRAVRPC